ncbi:MULTISPECIES: hypothetical protein [Microbispora]|uniref:Uncharacterized protein n=1 Tax=Microbispora bryophytorum subsp. camponoti TaxID=1677852 RepID=A0ABR8LA61_9ACTN|nr:MULTISPECIES: hypothetical protein [Microbispora]MBD3147798.1 hypothetical protein [Microbispora camponoti]
MDPSEFAAVKQQVMDESFPSSGADLDGMAMDFDAYLWHSPLIREVSVRRTGDTNNLIAATCWTVPGSSTVEIAAELERIWLQDLSYRHFEAHMITADERAVRLDAVTQIAPDDFYVTAAIVAETARPTTGGATR